MTDNDRRVWIYDTTLRDGTQSEGVSLSLEDKLLVAQRLDELGVDYIEGGYPLSNPKDKAFFEEIRKRGIRHAKVAAFGMTRRRGLEAVQDAGMKALLASEAPVVTIVGKSWDMQVSQVLAVSEQENLDMIAQSLALFVQHGREAIYDAEHFFDGYRANPDFALRTLQAAVQAGAGTLALCDTNGGAMYDFIGEVVAAVIRRFPGVRVGIHCHNDSAMAVASSLAAVAAGARHVQGTINGLGERCGNADLTSIIPNLVLKQGYDCLKSDSLANLTATSHFVDEIANLVPHDNQPFVGNSAFTHKGGMHVHAVQKNASTYEHIDPAVVGNHRKILVSELAGASNIVAKTQKFSLGNDKELHRKVLMAVQDMENEGYQFEAADASFELLVRRTLGGAWYHPFWTLDHYQCVVHQIDGGRPSTDAIVKLLVQDKLVHTVSDGDGPVNALDGALRKALLPIYPSLKKLKLVDYKVRVVNPKAGTAAKVRVITEFLDPVCGMFGTVGVDENLIHASFHAVVDAIEYKLLNEAEMAAKETQSDAKP